MFTCSLVKPFNTGYENLYFSVHVHYWSFFLFLLQVAKQWYDFDRSSFVFVRKLREGQSCVFRHQHDFDDNGIMYWIGTNAK